MKNMNKPTWQMLHNLAETIKNPTAKARMLADAEKMKIEERKTQNEVVGQYILSKFLDIAAVILTLTFTIIVVYLFTRSLFEGFIAFITVGILIRFLFKKRNNDWSSWFFMWF